MAVLPEPLPREALDAQLSPSLTAKNAAGVLLRHEEETAALVRHARLRLMRDQPYGPGARQRMDIFMPEAAAGQPCLAFIHGGFWQEGSKEGSGFAAEVCADRGWAHVGIGYTLAPEARLADIVDEIAAALAKLSKIAPEHGIDARKLILAGHSAGAHLVAAIMAGLGGDAAARMVAGAVLVSGVFELDPIARSYVNDKVGMTADDVAALSPMRGRPVTDIPTLILIGADESDAFQWQSDMLYRQWQPYLSRLSLTRVPGRDHFDILDELSDPEARAFRTMMEMAQ